MSNARAVTSLRKLRDDLSRMPEAIPVVAKRSAEAIKRAIDANIAAGRAPDGSSWAPREDGGKPLADAAQAVDVVAVGSTVVATVHGVEARHHAGKVKGGVARPILPRGKLPEPMRAAVQEIAAEELSRRRGAR
jgi:hypothetical protein